MKRIKIACDNCRRSHIKCSESIPCDNCIKKEKICNKKIGKTRGRKRKYKRSLKEFLDENNIIVDHPELLKKSPELLDETKEELYVICILTLMKRMKNS